MTESIEERSDRILTKLRAAYPGTACWDVDGSGHHFVSEIEPTKDHPDYDLAIEVIIKSKPHKHLSSAQYHRVISGTLHLRVADKTVVLHGGDKYTVEPGKVHWASSEDEAWVEIRSEPGWTREDHISV